MATLSPSDTAFEGFRITRERPEVLLVWAAFSFVVSLVMLWGTIAGGLGEILTAAENRGADPTRTIEALARGGPTYLLVLAFGLIVQSVFVSAVYRVVLRPEDNRFGYLRFGKDELRQIALFLVLVLIIMLATFLIALVGGLVSVVTGMLLNAAGPGGRALGGLAGVAIGLWVLGLVFYVIVRLSLSLPMTFAEQRLRVFASWKLTRGHFWRLLFAYGLAMLMLIVVWLLALVIFTAVAAIIGMAMGQDLAAVGKMFSPDMTSMSAYFSVPTFLYMLFSAVMSALYYAVVVAPSAVAYQILSGQKAAPET